MDKYLEVPQSSFYHVAIIPGLTRGPIRTNPLSAKVDAQAFGKKAEVRRLLPSEAQKYLIEDRRMLNILH